MKQVFEVKNSHKRVDVFLSQTLEISKSQALHLVKSSLVCINHMVCKKGGESLKIGDKVMILAPPVIPCEKPSEIHRDIAIIYEDSEILLLNKPPGLVVHSAPSVKEATLVDWLKMKGFSLSSLSGEERYGIVHRLDKQTSGAIIIAKTNQAHVKLSQQLKNREMGRYYLAIIDGIMPQKMTIECQIGRHPKNRLKMANLDTFRHKRLVSRYSKSDFIPLLESKNGKFQLIGAKLYTGRTHQIRAHLQTLSKHILGDRLYGYELDMDIRIMLHAYLIYFIHPLTGKKMFFKVPVFDDMLKFLNDNFDRIILDEVTREDFIFHCFDTF
ncbi:RluA family pseudouridine synthase [Helicobacter sp. 11S03491-1]|uniref:RluA family pseudouridine synthase n=1 Tax=Helicobacter sp. 11S03491-1 TaxID=1476196 RepID=UPI000BA5F8E9|nr:RluA family pseudouridine synthase [Helicobacter sp. 11S03491-1]PAF41973.1 RNA pseudouridine synthase [Helicobacter sp. 11S03491-1]